MVRESGAMIGDDAEGESATAAHRGEDDVAAGGLGHGGQLAQAGAGGQRGQAAKGLEGARGGEGGGVGAALEDGAEHVGAGEGLERAGAKMATIMRAPCPWHGRAGLDVVGQAGGPVGQA